MRKLLKRRALYKVGMRVLSPPPSRDPPPAAKPSPDVFWNTALDGNGMKYYWNEKWAMM